MKVVIWLFAAYLIVIGIAVIISPEVIRRMSRWFLSPLRLRVSTVVSAALGVLIFLGRLSTPHPMFTGGIGLVIAISGLVYLLLPWRTMERLNTWAMTLSDTAYRIYGVIYVILGVLLLV